MRSSCSHWCIVQLVQYVVGMSWGYVQGVNALWYPCLKKYQILFFYKLWILTVTCLIWITWIDALNPPPLLSIATTQTKSPKNLKTGKVYSMGLPLTLVLGIHRARSSRSRCCTIGLSHFLRSRKMPKCIGKSSTWKILKNRGMPLASNFLLEVTRYG